MSLTKKITKVAKSIAIGTALTTYILVNACQPQTNTQPTPVEQPQETIVQEEITGQILTQTENYKISQEGGTIQIEGSDISQITSLGRANPLNIEIDYTQINNPQITKINSRTFSYMPSNETETTIQIPIKTDVQGIVKTNTVPVNITVTNHTTQEDLIEDTIKNLNIDENYLRNHEQQIKNIFLTNGINQETKEIIEILTKNINRIEETDLMQIGTYEQITTGTFEKNLITTRNFTREETETLKNYALKILENNLVEFNGKSLGFDEQKINQLAGEFGLPTHNISEIPYGDYFAPHNFYRDVCEETPNSAYNTGLVCINGEPLGISEEGKRYVNNAIDGERYVRELTKHIVNQTVIEQGNGTVGGEKTYEKTLEEVSSLFDNLTLYPDEGYFLTSSGAGDVYGGIRSHETINLSNGNQVSSYDILRSVITDLTTEKEALNDLYVHFQDNVRHETSRPRLDQYGFPGINPNQAKRLNLYPEVDRMWLQSSRFLIDANLENDNIDFLGSGHLTGAFTSLIRMVGIPAEQQRSYEEFKNITPTIYSPGVTNVLKVLLNVEGEIIPFYMEGNIPFHWEDEQTINQAFLPHNLYSKLQDDYTNRRGYNEPSESDNPLTNLK